MNDEIKELLPVGSVVRLKDASKRIMITGFASVSPDTGDKVYDYSGCVFPEGFVDYDEVFVFDHNQIEQVCFTGFEDEEEKVFMNKLAEELRKIKEE
jgi:hypothetical protein